MEKTVEEEMFSRVEMVDEGIKEVEGERLPRLGEQGWSDYIISLLTDKELATVPGKTTKLPRTDGLRRICSLVFGEILKSKPHPTHVLYTDQGLVTVVAHELCIRKRNGEIIEVWGLADCRQECLTHPYNQHVTANASTKALGRAFRDAMQLQVVVAEEMNSLNDFDLADSDPDDAKPADNNQKHAIKKLCKTISIDIDKFVKLGAFPHKSIDDVLKGTAKKMISVLNGYHNNEGSIPENIKL